MKIADKQGKRNNYRIRPPYPIRPLAVLLLSYALILTPLIALGANSDVGTSGGQFLKIGPGARPVAMGEAFVGIADDVNAVHYNPAGLATLERPALTAMHTQWFQGMNYDFGAFVYPAEWGALAISATTLRADDLERRNADESFQGTFENSDSAYTLSYSKEIRPRLSVGVTGRYVQEEIDSVIASAFGGDIGVLKKFDDRPLSIGFAIKNFGQSLRFREESDPLPLMLDMGIGTSLLKKRLNLGFDLKKPRDNDFQFGLGGEWDQSLAKDFRFALRTGYNSAGTDADGTTGISLGGGIGYRLFDFDFAWVPFGDLGNTFRYSATLQF